MERLPLTQPPTARYRKVLIDSRLRSSGDYSNFQVTIPSDVQLGDLCYVASCSFANTFQTISEDNNTLYFRFRTTTPGGFSAPPNRRRLAFRWGAAAESAADRECRTFVADLDDATNYTTIEAFAQMMTDRVRASIRARVAVPADNPLPRVYSFNEFMRATAPGNPNPLQVPPSDSRHHRLFYVGREGRFEDMDLNISIFWIQANSPSFREQFGFQYPDSFNSILLEGLTDFRPSIPHRSSGRPPPFVAHRRTGVVIPSGNYTISTLADALALAMFRGGASVTVRADGDRLVFECDAQTQLQIPPAHAILDLPPGDLDDGAWPQAPAREIHYMLGIVGQADLVSRIPTQLIDLFPHRSIYLHSSILTANNTLAPSGLRDAIARIPIDVEYGGIVQYVSRTSDDAIHIQPQQGSTQIDFNFRDYRGQAITMGSYVSIELVFV